ncbi:MAG: UDP-N-acetylmuramoyl-L-alanine--D-glutamate ligase [Candidatus Margulisbacteria bacterium]|nr:UDP-N-acetylmuramoyl-L-alanine--D-glutamate ligase [Candidatus Margulisiibacteriota bacterium]
MHTQKIAILGDGITAKAVREKLNQLHIQETTVDAADLIVTSPGIPPHQYPNVSCEIISEIEFAYRLFKETDTPPTLIGITGTNGKSTVTALLAHVLDCPLAGNIGVPLITYVGILKKGAPIALELSSYQLEQCSTFYPHIAIFLNLTEDHIERHKTMHAYAEAKAKIFHNQTASDYLIYNQDEVNLKPLISTSLSQQVPYSLQDPDAALLNNLPIPGPHNQSNALSVLKAARLLGLSDTKILSKMQTFKGLEHRIEYIADLFFCPVYNDSKATNPDSTLKAVNAFYDPIHLIICGYDKGLELEAFIRQLHEKVKSITVFGAITARFISVSKKISPHFPLYKADTITDSLLQISQHTQKKDIILFSPACSSFDQFNNYEHRGQEFKKTVLALSQKHRRN